MNKILRILTELVFPPSEDEIDIHKLTLEKLRDLTCELEPPYDFVESILSYREARVRLLIHHVKYHANPQALYLGQTLLQEELLDILGESQQFGEYTNPLVIPIPVHISRKRKRGWNQCELLARKVAKELNLTYEPRALIRIRATESQTSMSSRKERLANPKDSFDVIDKDKIKDKDIILIDDVTTTGATLKEARDTLLQSGARNIKALTLAH